MSVSTSPRPMPIGLKDFYPYLEQPLVFIDIKGETSKRSFREVAQESNQIAKALHERVKNNITEYKSIDKLQLITNLSSFKSDFDSLNALVLQCADVMEKFKEMMGQYPQNLEKDDPVLFKKLEELQSSMQMLNAEIILTSFTHLMKPERWALNLLYTNNLHEDLEVLTKVVASKA